MNDESLWEKVAGSLTVASASTVVAAISGGPVAALLPVLTSTLANGRHKKRVENALCELEKELNALGESIKNISDAQYKFINETVLTILHSPDDKKIAFLKEGIRNSVIKDRLNLHQAGQMSRILRDITVEELTLLIECHKSGILFHDKPMDGCYNIKKDSLDDECARGLIYQGLLSKKVAEGLWDLHGQFEFTPAAHQLVELISG